MHPVLTVPEMQAADKAALRTVDEATLVRRAGTAAARAALSMLGGAYGRRVVVLAGKGNNGADGQVAAGVLTQRGARVQVLEVSGAPEQLPPCDLVVDAAFGTGFRGSYDAPVPPAGTPVLAIDIPSGVSGDTGQAGGRPMRATRTVTFAALKLGLLQGDGHRLAGEVSVADIGIDIPGASAALVDDEDLAVLVPRRPADGYKWETALVLVAGSPGMEGAANFSARGASHAGAGMVRLAVPAGAGRGPKGATAPGPWPLEAVRTAVGDEGWSDDVLEIASRCRALVVGPGLGRSESTVRAVRRLIERCPVPVLADADALFALGDAEAARGVIAGKGVDRPVVLTPHDGEYARLAGNPPGENRVTAARALSERTGAVVLLKGRLTVVAAPPGGSSGVPEVLLAAAGSPRLATAGTGDVLSGVIGAFMARGLDAQLAAALGAHLHGEAAGLGPAEGLVAGDLPDLVARRLTTALRADGGSVG